MEPVSPEAAVAQPEPKFPGIVLAAGIIWIVVGSLILLGTVVLAVLVPMLTQNAELAGGAGCRRLLGSVWRSVHPGRCADG